MNLHLFHALMLRLRRPLVGWLVLAVVVYGPSSTLLQMLGPAHRHEAPTAARTQTVVAGIQDMFRDLRAWRAQVREQWLGEPAPGTRAHAQAHAEGRVHVHAAVPAEPHAHAHAGFSRHHHDASDPTVIALDGGAAASADGASPASSGSATLQLALTTFIGLPPLVAAQLAWPAARRDRWADTFPLPLDRPPRA